MLLTEDWGNDRLIKDKKQDQVQFEEFKNQVEFEDEVEFKEFKNQVEFKDFVEFKTCKGTNWISLFDPAIKTKW